MASQRSSCSHHRHINQCNNTRPTDDTVHTFEIEVVNLCYDVMPSLSPRMKNNHHGPMQILKNVSFKAKSGELLALAGPSGCGKSTLLGLLAGAITQPTISNNDDITTMASKSILINNRPTVDAFTLRRISGYVPQSDALFPLLTVKETLLFSAHIRLPSSAFKLSEKLERVESLMAELGLAHVGNRRVGNVHVDMDTRGGLSGGERRRVSIGVELIHDPPVLLLDEPTSGLDSSAALKIVGMLHSMAKNRSRTIVLSIHQPSYRIMEHMNSILLLARGHVVHHGTLEQLQWKLVQAGHQIEPQVNILEYAIEDIMSSKGGSMMHMHSQVDHRLFSTNKLPESTGGSMMAQHGAKQHLRQHWITSMSLESTKLFHGLFAFEYNNGCPREVVILTQRFARNIFRASELFTQRALQSLGAGVALGTIYMNISGGSRMATEADRLGFFAFTLTFLFSSTMEALPIFLRERDIVEMESRRGAYRVCSYVMANVFVFLPFLLLLAMLYAMGAYWLVGVKGPMPLTRDPEAFGFFVLVLWLALTLANSFLSFVVTLVPDYIVGNSIIATCFGFFFLFSGYFISLSNMPTYWRFMHYISLFKYPLDALLVNEFGSSSDGETRCFATSNYGSNSFCILSGENILTELGLQYTSKWQSVSVMISFACLYRFLGYFMLLLKVWRATTKS